MTNTVPCGVRRSRGSRLGLLAMLVLPLLAGGCSLPDWADPFGSDYGPVPQPVSRVGSNTALPAPPPETLAADTANRRYSGEQQVAAVASPAPVEPVRAAPPPVQAPAPAAAPAVSMPAPTPAPTPAPAPAAAVASAPAATAAPAPTGESPTPMIAAMIRGGTPPTFSGNDTGVPRRTTVTAASSQPSILSAPATPAAAPAVAASAPPSPAGAPALAASTSVEQTDIRSGPASAAALAPAAPQPLLTRTYRDQLRAAGIDAGESAAPAAASGVVAPGQFSNRVPAVVQQTYRESLNAPRTWEQAVGLSPLSPAPSTVTIGGAPSAGSGPVVISGDGVYQPASHVASARSGARLTIQFANNSAQLSPSDVEMIRPVAEEVRRTGARVRVVGHASSRTGEMRVGTHLLANLQISADRAEAVADALARYGVPYERIVVEAKGDNQPLFNEAMPSGETGNRRAEIYLEN